MWSVGGVLGGAGLLTGWFSGWVADWVAGLVGGWLYGWLVGRVGGWRGNSTGCVGVYVDLKQGMLGGESPTQERSGQVIWGFAKRGPCCLGRSKSNVAARVCSRVWQGQAGCSRV